MGRLKSPEGHRPDFDWETSVTQQLAAAEAAYTGADLTLDWCTGLDNRQAFYNVTACPLSHLMWKPLDCGGLAWQIRQQEGTVPGAWAVYFDDSQPHHNDMLETIEFVVAPDRPLQCVRILYPTSVQGNKYNDYWRDVEADIKDKMARGETVADDSDRQLLADAMQKLGIDSYMLIEKPWPRLSDD